MTLELDLGNTRIKWRTIDRGSDALDGGAFLVEEKQSLGNVLGLVNAADKVRLASVRDMNMEIEICRACRERNIEFFSARTQSQCAGVINGYSDPSKMGVDRWLAMVAGYNFKKSACCVVDCGSAITVDIINDHGKHQGGYIVPGFGILKMALFQSTERVHFSLNEQLNACSPGCDTQQAVSHGSLSMVVSWLNSLYSQLRNDYGESSYLYLTGGDAGIVARHLGGEILHRPDLVMEGLVYCEAGELELFKKD